MFDFFSLIFSKLAVGFTVILMSTHLIATPVKEIPINTPIVEETPVEIATSVEAPKEAPKEVHKEVVKKAPKETIKEEPEVLKAQTTVEQVEQVVADPAVTEQVVQVVVAPILTLTSITPTVNSVKIEWQTDLPTESKVFISGGNLSSEVFISASGLSTRHSTTITRLSAGVSYSYEIEAIVGGTDVTKSQGSFTTLPPPPPPLKRPTVRLSAIGILNLPDNYTIPIIQGDPMNISWTSTEADKCLTSWAGDKGVSGSTSVMTDEVRLSAYVVTCNNAEYTTSKKIMVRVRLPVDIHYQTIPDPVVKSENATMGTFRIQANTPVTIKGMSVSFSGSVPSSARLEYLTIGMQLSTQTCSGSPCTVNFTFDTELGEGTYGKFGIKADSTDFTDPLNITINSVSYERNGELKTLQNPIVFPQLDFKE